MSKYVNISLEEFSDFLKIEKGWHQFVQGNEIVFNFILPSSPEITIKVFSGVRKDTQWGRKCGQDAIRVCAVHTIKNIGWIKSARVYRVEGWKDNLKSRVLEVISKAKERLNRPF